ncbi:TPA: hypothetical protein SOL98_001209 [Clostridioides difficile]|uniref:YqzN/YkzM domain-containing protein n=3 Tax=root TaxID=1 RepID=A0A3G1E376_9CAUD|nr:hypothetical protein [Clostridioides difficile]YP_009195772.1 conserved hypothetical protein; skin element [Clostridium phage phiCD505]YP_009830808.1 hypothetical protein HWA97_gp12 [Clostridium phage CDKM9]EQI37538.1 hypothetical protein QOS_1398 [Clostridioides difficile Y184]EQK81122.1 hypothetical protein QEG_2841 [Clostridioides difficile CD127]ANT45080.1 hypothetical protein CDHM9_12 [Clostridium phage CDKM9]AUA20400.1 hypothetical protein CWR55_01205 [Clostridioides difficile]EGT36
MAETNNKKINVSKQEEKYLKSDFIENSEALGYKKEVVAGALFNCKKEELTKSEFEKAIKEFLEREVK